MHKIEMRRRELGFSVADVAVLTGLSVGTIYRIEREDPDDFKVGFSTAIAFAEGLDSQLHTLFDASELTIKGRPALTGKPIDDLAKKRREKAMCPVCNLFSSHKEREQGESECHNKTLVVI